MKQRKGFVSNSSSSSFIIAYEPSLTCPHCGRSDVDFADMIRASSDSYEDTHVVRKNAGDVLNDLYTQLTIKNNDIKKLSVRNPQENMGSYYGSWTVGQEIKSVTDEIEELIKTIDKVKEYMQKQWNVIEINLSHHAEEIYEHLRNNEKKIHIIGGGDR